MMKSMKIYAWGMIAVTTSLLIVSCTKSFKDPQPINTNLDNKSKVQVFIGTVNANRNVVMVDGKRVSRPTLASGLSFPTAIYPSTNTGSSFTVEGGVRSFMVMDTLSSTTQKPLVFSTNLDVGKLYNIFTYDTITAPKQITIETPIETPPDGFARIRFVNLIHDANAVPAVDVYSWRRNEVLFSNINRTEFTDFITTPAQILDTFQIRQAGTTTVLATYPNGVQTSNFIPTNGRTYTLIYRGSHRGTRTASIIANN